MLKILAVDDGGFMVEEQVPEVQTDSDFRPMLRVDVKSGEILLDRLGEVLGPWAENHAGNKETGIVNAKIQPNRRRQKGVRKVELQAS